MIPIILFTALPPHLVKITLKFQNIVSMIGVIGIKIAIGNLNTENPDNSKFSIESV